MTYIDKYRYHGLLRFLFSRGRVLTFLIISFLCIQIAPSAKADISLDENLITQTEVGDIFKKLNFLSGPALGLIDPIRQIDLTAVSKALGVSLGSKMPQVNSEGTGVLTGANSKYQIPKDLSADNFFGSLKEILVFVWNILLVTLGMMKDLIVRIIEYIK